MAIAYMFNPPEKRILSERVRRPKGITVTPKTSPGLALSMFPTRIGKPAKHTHPPSRRIGGKKIQNLLGAGKWFLHRGNYWSRDPEGGSEGVRSPYYIRNRRRNKKHKKANHKGGDNIMARRKRSSRRRSRKHSFKRNPVRKHRRVRRSSWKLFKMNPRRRRSRRHSKKLFKLNPRRRHRRSRRRGFSKLYKMNPFKAQLMGYGMKDIVKTSLLGLAGFIISKTVADKVSKIQFVQSQSPIVQSVVRHGTALVAPLAAAWAIKKFAKKDELAKAIAIGGMISFGHGAVKAILAKYAPDNTFLKDNVSFGEFVPEELSGFITEPDYSGLGVGSGTTSSIVAQNDPYAPAY